MKNLDDDVQCQALSEYAHRKGKDSLNNPPAYFMSLLQVRCIQTFVRLSVQTLLLLAEGPACQLILNGLMHREHSTGFSHKSDKTAS